MKKSELLGYAANSPATWLFCAVDLKTAADRIDWVQSPVREDEPSIHLASVYKLLLGLSFENLFKGILAARGEQVLNTKNVLSKGFETHRLINLAERMRSAGLSFSTPEKDVLQDLEHYVLWAGRYPLPKCEKDVVVKSHSSHEYDAGRILWNRVHDYLHGIAWVMKAGGRRLHLTVSQT